MLSIKKYIPQAGILAGYPVIELDCSKGVLIRRVKADPLLSEIATLGAAQYLYLHLSSGNLKDKELKKLLSKFAMTHMQIFVRTDCKVAEGLASILHLVSGVELCYTDSSAADIRRICLLAATRALQINLEFEKLSLIQELNSFLPLFSELPFADINIYLSQLAEFDTVLPSNVKIRYKV